jgi:hypothetical protein
MKRVTIRNIDPAAWQTIRHLSLETGRTVAEVIEACIRFGSAQVIEEFATAKAPCENSSEFDKLLEELVVQIHKADQLLKGFVRLLQQGGAQSIS